MTLPSLPSGPLFDVMSRDMHGDPVRCSYCAQKVALVAVLPLTVRPGLEDRLPASDGDTLWLGLCARCVEMMRLALALGESLEPGGVS